MEEGEVEGGRSGGKERLERKIAGGRWTSAAGERESERKKKRERRGLQKGAKGGKWG